jgi:ketosteroid isomerase-like protein
MLIALAACASPPVVTELSDDDRTALQGIADRDAELVMARAWDSLAALYEGGAVRLPPNAPPLQGRAAIRQNFDAIPPLHSLTFRMVSLDGGGRLALGAAPSARWYTPGPRAGDGTRHGRCDCGPIPG